MILLIDNYDSFVFNLARYFERLGQQTLVVRNDAIDPRGILALKPQAVVLSPGPCTPNEAGCSLEVVQRLHEQVPILGICLGHQAIAAALGGRVTGAPEPVHGRSSQIFHAGEGLFAGMPSPMVGGRYHSLVVEESTLPPCLKVTARTADGIVMALQHRQLPVVGLQFHPESILSTEGFALLARFLQLAGAALPAVVPDIDSERSEPAMKSSPLPVAPVTF